MLGDEPSRLWQVLPRGKQAKEASGSELWGQAAVLAEKALELTWWAVVLPRVRAKAALAQHHDGGLTWGPGSNPWRKGWQEWRERSFAHPVSGVGAESHAGRPLLLVLLQPLSLASAWAPGLLCISPPLQTFSVPREFLSLLALPPPPATPGSLSSPLLSLLFIYSEGFTVLPCRPN